METIKRKQIPITRNNLFFGKEDYEYELKMGKDYIEQDLNMTVVLYQIDRLLTNTDYVYGETQPNEIKYKTPVELHCIYKIDKASNNAYVKHNNSARYKQTGNIEINIYERSLEEMECDINIGDFIGVPINETTIQYFEVMDDGKKNWSNQESMWGYKPFWRKIKGSEIDENIFNG